MSLVYDLGSKELAGKRLKVLSAATRQELNDIVKVEFDGDGNDGWATLYAWVRDKSGTAFSNQEDNHAPTVSKYRALVLAEVVPAPTP